MANDRDKHFATTAKVIPFTGHNGMAVSHSVGNEIGVCFIIKEFPYRRICAQPNTSGRFASVAGSLDDRNR